MLAANTALVENLDELQRKYTHSDQVIAAILSTVRELTDPLGRKSLAISITAHLDT